MEHYLFEYFLFLFKALTIVFVIILIIKSSKSDITLPLEIISLNKRYRDEKKSLQKLFKIKPKKEKKKKKLKKNIYILNFNGDLRASAVNGLRREVSALLGIIRPGDQVMLKLESPGGTVNDYGLAHAQLRRLRDQKINLTVCVDRVAASGGYLMACVANKIIAAPFAYIGSIGVAMELINFHGILEKNKINAEVITSKKYKRTLTQFSKPTDEGRAKVREDLALFQGQFESSIGRYRPQVNMKKAATGEYWSAENAIKLGLIDELATSDHFIQEHIDQFNLYEIKHPQTKTIKAKLFKKLKAYVGL